MHGMKSKIAMHSKAHKIHTSAKTQACIETEAQIDSYISWKGGKQQADSDQLEKRQADSDIS
jgi:hypothetical protein